MDKPTAWLVPPPEVILPETEVHIWRASLEKAAPKVADLARILSPDEVARAQRFHFPRDRNRFVVARGLLRQLLGVYLREDPSQVRFQYGPQGKPMLHMNASSASAIAFNLAHSQGTVLYAFAKNRQLGVDVEQIRDDFPIEEIAKRYFSGCEINELLSLPLTQRREAFFLAWTRKEAYIKARGEGLQTQLDSFDVTLTPERPPLFLRGVELSWRLTSFSVFPRFPGCLVYDGPSVSEVRHFHVG